MSSSFHTTSSNQTSIDYISLYNLIAEQYYSDIQNAFSWFLLEYNRLAKWIFGHCPPWLPHVKVMKLIMNRRISFSFSMQFICALVTSHERQDVSYHRRLQCFLNTLFRLTKKNASKFCSTEPSARGNPSKRASNAENVPATYHYHVSMRLLLYAVSDSICSMIQIYIVKTLVSNVPRFEHDDPEDCISIYSVVFTCLYLMLDWLQISTFHERLTQFTLCFIGGYHWPIYPYRSGLS